MRLILKVDLEVRVPITPVFIPDGWLQGNPYDNGPRKPQKANLIKMCIVLSLYCVTLQAVNKNDFENNCLLEEVAHLGAACTNIAIWSLRFSKHDANPKNLQ